MPHNNRGAIRLAVAVVAISAAACGARAAAVPSTTPTAPASGHPAPAAHGPLRWRIEPVPVPVGALSQGLTGVACPASDDCLAVGGWYPFHGGNGTVLERWDGTSWHRETAPAPAGSVQESALAAISCVSTDFCVAVGDIPTAEYNDAAFADVWDGTVWRLVRTPVPYNEVGTYLASVSCTSPLACVATGYGETPAQTETTLAESWNGRAWTLSPTPDPVSSVGGNRLLSVSCAATDACMAVGEHEDPDAVTSLSEWWDGARWSLVPALTPTGDGELVGVACPAADRCTAVGTDSSEPAAGSWAESWNGARWSVERLAGTGLWLDAVTCLSPRSCTAVGARQVDQGSETLVEAWNGHTWAIVPTPNPVLPPTVPATMPPGTGTEAPPFLNELLAVQCAGPAACMAVGNDGPGGATAIYSEAFGR